MPEAEQIQVCKQITAETVAAIDSQQVILLDVRSPIEFESEQITGSINIPLDELAARTEEIARQGELILVCRSGKRAERAAYMLMGKGFSPKVMEGGILSWTKAGLPLKEGKKRLPIERQVQLIIGTGLLAGVTLGLLVNKWFFAIPAFFGAGLTFAGLTGNCGLAILLMKAPWNRLEIPAGKSKPGGTAGTETGKQGCCGN